VGKCVKEGKLEVRVFTLARTSTGLVVILYGYAEFRDASSVWHGTKIYFRPSESCFSRKLLRRTADEKLPVG
jgi:hypothetical protein